MLTARLRRTEAARERQILKLHKQGRTQRTIADELDMPRSTVALILKRCDGYESPLASDGWVNAYAVATELRLKPATLNNAIDNELVRGKRTVRGKKTYRWVRPAELEEDLATRRELSCTYPSCEGKALPLSLGQRCMKHTGDVTLPGTKFRGERCRAMAAAKVGQPRPDVRERIAAMHADRRQRYAWGLRLLQGRAERSCTPSPASWGRWHGRVEGLKAGRQGGKMKGYTDKHVSQARGLKKLDPNIGRGRLSKLLRISEEQARAILAQLRLEGG